MQKGLWEEGFLHPKKGLGLLRQQNCWQSNICKGSFYWAPEHCFPFFHIFLKVELTPNTTFFSPVCVHHSSFVTWLTVEQKKCVKNLQYSFVHKRHYSRHTLFVHKKNKVWKIRRLRTFWSRPCTWRFLLPWVWHIASFLSPEKLLDFWKESIWLDVQEIKKWLFIFFSVHRPRLPTCLLR